MQFSCGPLCRAPGLHALDNTLFALALPVRTSVYCAPPQKMAAFAPGFMLVYLHSANNTQNNRNLQRKNA